MLGIGPYKDFFGVEANVDEANLCPHRQFFGRFWKICPPSPRSAPVSRVPSFGPPPALANRPDLLAAARAGSFPRQYACRSLCPPGRRAGGAVGYRHAERVPCVLACRLSVNDVVLIPGSLITDRSLQAGKSSKIRRLNFESKSSKILVRAKLGSRGIDHAALRPET